MDRNTNHPDLHQTGVKLTCTAGISVVSWCALVTFGAVVVGFAETLARDGTTGVQRCTVVTGAHWEMTENVKLNKYKKEEEDIRRIISVCVWLTLAVWVQVDTRATLITKRTSELGPAQTLTGFITHLRCRANDTTTTNCR